MTSHYQQCHKSAVYICGKNILQVRSLMNSTFLPFAFVYLVLDINSNITAFCIKKRRTFLTMIEPDSLITGWCGYKIKLGQFHITCNIDSSAGSPLIHQVILCITNWNKKIFFNFLFSFWHLKMFRRHWPECDNYWEDVKKMAEWSVVRVTVDKYVNT